MKNLLRFLATLTLLLTTAALVTATDKVEGPDSCKYCGMDRTRFSHSRMLVTYQDGSSTGTCSLHCMAVELANNIDKMPTSIKVGDFTTQKLIDAETAHWVIGGDRMGVMTSRAKWAFASKADAEAFIKAHKGTLGSFDDAIKAAYEDMYNDTRMIRERRKMMKMKHDGHH
ncbi:nitrous oxide reductase accessory protein NosL [Trichlorobacter lovleyi]|uniref:nitrous oxide reductase accessory protein NosL n=1 Tax=Trichlorobacter lovleyi TaxID=313985 RepID=UPI002480EFE3|nr:nitrous oxide reductase accessory protein NosL [Trichlorobacter lovleyi]